MRPASAEPLHPTNHTCTQIQHVVFTLYVLHCTVVECTQFVPKNESNIRWFRLCQTDGQAANSEVDKGGYAEYIVVQTLNLAASPIANKAAVAPPRLWPVRKSSRWGDTTPFNIA